MADLYSMGLRTAFPDRLKLVVGRLILKLAKPID